MVEPGGRITRAAKLRSVFVTAKTGTKRPGKLLNQDLLKGTRGVLR